MQLNKANYKQVDSYSMLIISKYFKTSHDFINITCVNSKFKEITEKLRFNPISIKSLKLFPKIQTQYLYSAQDTKIEGIDNYEIWYEIDYDEYLKYKGDNIKCHIVVYTEKNRKKYGNQIHDGITVLGKRCFNNQSGKEDTKFLKEINIPSSVKKLSSSCFMQCESLESVILPSSLTSLCNECFHWCEALTSINLPFTLTSIGIGCFSDCISLKSITIPSSITTLSDECFSECPSLTSIDLPSTLTSIGNHCFSDCESLTSINLPSSLKELGKYCFLDCVNLELVIGVEKLKIGLGCFDGCSKLRSQPMNSN
ncbi:Leucine rich repeat protein bspa family [Entamoeba marina]